MKTFIKILVGFILGVASAAWFIDWAFAIIAKHPEIESCKRVANIMANYLQEMGYDIKDKETDEFEFGFH